MDEFFTRFWGDVVGRLSGPMAFRLILQPTMSILFAVRDGINDARAGRPAYLWAIFNRPRERGSLLREEWKALARVIGLGVVMDAVYQFMVFRTFRPLELVVVVLLLVLIPYLVWRGPVNRIARHWIAAKRATAH